MSVTTLKKRADFVRLSSHGHKFIVSSFILLAAPTADSTGNSIRFGLTATRKLGGAVVRNRIRRRLRAAFREIASSHARSGYDYVLIARKSALHCPYSTLIRDLTFALPRLHRTMAREEVPTSEGKTA